MHILYHNLREKQVNPRTRSTRLRLFAVYRSLLSIPLRATASFRISSALKTLPGTSTISRQSCQARGIALNGTCSAADSRTIDVTMVPVSRSDTDLSRQLQLRELTIWNLAVSYDV